MHEPITMPRAVPSTDQGNGKSNVLKRHIVKLDAAGKPLDECLCGYVWDRVFIEHGEEICQTCVDELKKRK